MLFEQNRIRRFVADRQGAISAIFALVVYGGFFVMIYGINHLAEFSSLDRAVRSAARSTAFQLAQTRLDWTKPEEVAEAANSAFNASMLPSSRLALTVTAERTGATVVVNVVGTIDAGLLGSYGVNAVARAPLKELTVSVAFSVAHRSATPSTTTTETAPPPNRLLASAIVDELRDRFERDHRVRVGFVPFNHQVRIRTDDDDATACIRNEAGAGESDPGLFNDFPVVRCTIGSSRASIFPEMMPPKPIGQAAADSVPDQTIRDRLNREATEFDDYLRTRLRRDRGLRYGGCRNVTLGLVAAYKQVVDLDPVDHEAVVVLIVDGAHGFRYGPRARSEREKRFCETGQFAVPGDMEGALIRACTDTKKIRKRLKEKRRKDGTSSTVEYPDMPLRLVIVDVGGAAIQLPADCRREAVVVSAPARIDRFNAAAAARSVVDAVAGTTGEASFSSGAGSAR